MEMFLAPLPMVYIFYNIYLRKYVLMLVISIEESDFPIGILGQVWYLTVSIPDLCTFTYFDCYLLKRGYRYHNIRKILFLNSTTGTQS